MMSSTGSNPSPVTPGSSLIAADPAFVPSATLVTVTVTIWSLGMVAGAV
jgi:hypothetical protein